MRELEIIECPGRPGRADWDSRTVWGWDPERAGPAGGARRFLRLVRVVGGLPRPIRGRGPSPPVTRPSEALSPTKRSVPNGKLS